MEATHTPDRMVISAAGVDHARMVELAQSKFGDMKRSDPSSLEAVCMLEPESEYIGSSAGDIFAEEVQVGPKQCHVAFAFPAVGWADSDVVATCLLDTMAGGGSSFSAGGPGKGMYSRFYREVLARHGWMDQANAFSLQFAEQGLLGSYGATTDEDWDPMLQVLAENVHGFLARPADPVELSRAKKQLQSSIMMNLEMRGVLCEDIGRQVITLGKRFEAQDLCDRIDKVTSEELVEIARKSMMQPMSLVMLNGIMQRDDQECRDNLERVRENMESFFKAEASKVLDQTAAYGSPAAGSA